MNERARKGKGISTFIMLLFVLSAFSPLLISASASDSLPYTEADPGTGINACSDEAQAIVDNARNQKRGDLFGTKTNCGTASEAYTPHHLLIAHDFG